MDKDRWIFVIDTDSFAGNFERELCANVCGQVSEHGVGEEFAQLFNADMKVDHNKDHPFEFVICDHNESGFLAPSSIWPTPGWFNHGLGGHFQDGYEAEAKEDCLKQQKHFYPEKRLPKGPVQKFPAFLSVGIFMARRPTAKEMDIIRVRSVRFASEIYPKSPLYGGKVNVTGFRLLHEKATQELSLSLPLMPAKKKPRRKKP